MGWLLRMAMVLVFLPASGEALPILTDQAVWVCPPEEPFCFGVPTTIRPPVTTAPPVTVAPPVSDAPPILWLAVDPPAVLGAPGAGSEEPPLAGTPEPGTLLLVGSALVLLGWRVRRGR